MSVNGYKFSNNRKTFLTTLSVLPILLTCESEPGSINGWRASQIQVDDGCCGDADEHHVLRELKAESPLRLPCMNNRK